MVFFNLRYNLLVFGSKTLFPWFCLSFHIYIWHEPWIVCLSLHIQKCWDMPSWDTHYQFSIKTLLSRGRSGNFLCIQEYTALGIRSSRNIFSYVQLWHIRSHNSPGPLKYQFSSMRHSSISFIFKSDWGPDPQNARPLLASQCGSLYPDPFSPTTPVRP